MKHTWETHFVEGRLIPVVGGRYAFIFGVVPCRTFGGVVGHATPEESKCAPCSCVWRSPRSSVLSPGHLSRRLVHLRILRRRPSSDKTSTPLSTSSAPRSSEPAPEEDTNRASFASSAAVANASRLRSDAAVAAAILVCPSLRRRVRSSAHLISPKRRAESPLRGSVIARQ